jgi:hypothetical protein
MQSSISPFGKLDLYRSKKNEVKDNIKKKYASQLKNAGAMKCILIRLKMEFEFIKKMNHLLD